MCTWGDTHLATFNAQELMCDLRRDEERQWPKRSHCAWRKYWHSSTSIDRATKMAQNDLFGPSGWPQTHLLFSLWVEVILFSSTSRPPPVFLYMPHNYQGISEYPCKFLSVGQTLHSQRTSACLLFLSTLRILKLTLNEWDYQINKTLTFFNHVHYFHRK